jgi:hypothetical protein
MTREAHSKNAKKPGSAKAEPGDRSAELLLLIVV